MTDTIKNNYVILDTVDVSSFTRLGELYQRLLSIKKEEFADNERIIIIYNSTKQKTVVGKLLLEIDIPDFFVIFQLIDNDNGNDFDLSDSFCIYPWINLEIGNTGQIRPCCKFKDPVPNANIVDSNIYEVYHGDYLRNIRRQFLQGEKPHECSSCWNEEIAGIASMRQGAKHKFKDIYYMIDYQSENFNHLQSFDLKMGNRCNLSCNICNAAASSTIADIEYTSNKISIVEFNKLKAAVSWAYSESFWDQLLGITRNLKYLDLYGGEPLMSKIHFNFLKKLIELDVAKNIKLDYNTNGTIYSEKFFEYWQHFKEVKLSFSIDDIDERFEQQRTGAKWGDVCANIKKYNSRKSDKFITEVFPTINSQNVYWLPELIDWINTQSFDHLAFNLLTHPQHYNIQSLSSDSKTSIIKKFKNLNSHNILDSIVHILSESNITEYTRP